MLVCCGLPCYDTSERHDADKTRLIWIRLAGEGNNPMVGMTVSVAVAIEESAKAGKF